MTDTTPEAVERLIGPGAEAMPDGERLTALVQMCRALSAEVARLKAPAPTEDEATKFDRADWYWRTMDPADAIRVLPARKIKPLEWRGDEGVDDRTAFGITPGFWVTWEEDGLWTLAPPFKERSYHPTLEDAKAAAQADYEARVWAAFEDAPAGDTPGSMSIEGESQ